VRYLTDEDLKPFNSANRKGGHATLIFPWIADRGSAADQKVYDLLPALVRLFLQPAMQHKYRKRFA
jgi:hypothetical protein